LKLSSNVKRYSASKSNTKTEKPDKDNNLTGEFGREDALKGTHLQ